MSVRNLGPVFYTSSFEPPKEKKLLKMVLDITSLWIWKALKGNDDELDCELRKKFATGSSIQTSRY
jgi:hypothetical protein